MGFGTNDGPYIGQDPADVFKLHMTGVNTNADSTIQAAQRAITQTNAEHGIVVNPKLLDLSVKEKAQEASLGRVGPRGYGRSIRFPQDHLQNDSDYVMFNFFRYTPPFKAPGQTSTSDSNFWTDKGSSGGLGQGKDYSSTFSTQGNNNQLDVYNKSAMFSRAETLTPIVLYMPEDISSSYKTNWTGKAFSNIARDAMEAASAEGWGKIDGLARGVDSLMKRSKALAGAQAIRTATQKITGDTLSNDDVFGGISGVILNPNAEMLFSGTEFRNFSLNYKLVPRNEDEARAIRQIISTFKQAMLPSHSTAGADASVFGTATGVNAIGDEATKNGREFSTGSVNMTERAGWDFWGWAGTGGVQSLDNAFIAVPNLCNVAFMSGSGLNPHVPQYKMCAITNVDVNYTPDGAWATYGDGSPVAIQLTVSFQETKLLFAEDVASGAF